MGKTNVEYADEQNIDKLPTQHLHSWEEEKILCAHQLRKDTSVFIIDIERNFSQKCESVARSGLRQIGRKLTKDEGNDGAKELNELRNSLGINVSFVERSSPTTPEAHISTKYMVSLINIGILKSIQRTMSYFVPGIMTLFTSVCSI